MSRVTTASSTRRSVVVLLSIVLTAASLAAVVLPSPQAVASTTAVDGFNAGELISDGVFYDYRAMNAGQIQQFFVQRGASCTSTAASICIKDFKQDTPNRAPDQYCPRPFVGQQNDSAANIIAKAAEACGINPQVLIVTLQKEQSLMTMSRPAHNYNRALGFGCPDNVGGWCDPQWAGFANQVYSAARQFQIYRATAATRQYAAGRYNTILYNPDVSCGTASVFIKNQATAGLYLYTPYVPNAAALKAILGTGDKCSSYGNRNFYAFFKTWFGNPISRDPIGSVQSVAQTQDGKFLRVRGWALDFDTDDPIGIHAYNNGQIATVTTADKANSTAQALYGRPNNHGFDFEAQVGLGPYNLCVFAIDNAGGWNPRLSCHAGTISNRLPVGKIENATANATGKATVSGWVYDPDSPNPATVHIYVNGRAVAVQKADIERAAVSQARGRTNTNIGFQVELSLPSGTNEVCVYGIDSDGGWNPKLDCVKVTAKNNLPVGKVEIVQGKFPDSISVSGWMYDPDSANPIASHIYVNGVAAKVLTADLPRPEIAESVGRVGGDQVGFSATIPARPGVNEVCVYAIDSDGGWNPKLECRTINLANSLPRGTIESVSYVGEGKVAVSGWLLDTDTDSPIVGHIYVDGKGIANTTANLARPEVATPEFYTNKNIGYSVTVPVAPGVREICVYGIDPHGGWNPKLSCKSVAIPNSPPIGKIESATTAVGGVVNISGWLFDPDTASPITGHIYVDGKGVGRTVADLNKPGVPEAASRSNNNIGFTTSVTVAPGNREICLYGIDAQGGLNPKVSCVTVNVPLDLPIGEIESATLSNSLEQGTTVTVRGWAYDVDANSPIMTHLYLDGKAVAVTQANLVRNDLTLPASRPDNRVGFEASFKVTPGTREICLYGIDTQGIWNPKLGCTEVSVVSTLPIGALDEVTISSDGIITASGWAFDPDHATSIAVHFYRNSSSWAAQANVPRPDIAQQFGRTGDHGFNVSKPAVVGENKVCMYAMDVELRWNPLLGCQTVQYNP